jgi:hypothetical protein
MTPWLPCRTTGLFPLWACLEAINLESPDLVAAMHSERIEAGAGITKTTLSGPPAFVSTPTASLAAPGGKPALRQDRSAGSSAD